MTILQPIFTSDAAQNLVYCSFAAVYFSCYFCAMPPAAVIQLKYFPFGICQPTVLLNPFKLFLR